MSATSETLVSLAGDLKTVYGTGLVQVLPESAIMQKRFPLSNSAAFPVVGDYFQALVLVQYPAGVSFLGQGTEATATNDTLGEALAGKTLPAQVYGNMSVLSDNLNYFVLDRSAATDNAKQSVLSALSLTGKSMAISLRNVLELEILHGRDGLGASAGAISTLTVTLDPATTSSGILSTLIGFRAQWMQSNLTSARTANDTSNYLTISAVDFSDPAAPTLTMVATGTTNYAAITTGDVLYIAGSRGVAVVATDTSVPQYEQIGLSLQLRATTGTQFAIDKAAYPGWRSNQMATVGPFNPSVVMNMAAKAASRGAPSGKYICLVSPRAWAVCNSALQVNEIFTNGSGSMQKKAGTDDIEVINDGMSIELVSHPFQKDGQAYLLPVDDVFRIGSTDMTFSIPGRSEGEEFWYNIPGRALMARQCRADFQVVCLKPPFATIATGITF